MSLCIIGHSFSLNFHSALKKQGIEHTYIDLYKHDRDKINIPQDCSTVIFMIFGQESFLHSFHARTDSGYASAPISLLKEIVKEEVVTRLSYVLTLFSKLTTLPKYFLSPPPPCNLEKLVLNHINCMLHLGWNGHKGIPMQPDIEVIWEEYSPSKDWSLKDYEGNIARLPDDKCRTLWDASNDKRKELCEKEGIIFVPAPENVTDEKGMILNTYIWDGLHANEEYGHVLIQQLKNLKILKG